MLPKSPAYNRNRNIIPNPEPTNSNRIWTFGQRFPPLARQQLLTSDVSSARCRTARLARQTRRPTRLTTSTCSWLDTINLSMSLVDRSLFDIWHKHVRPVFGRLPGPNRAWLLVVYFSRQASQLSVCQSRDYRVYIPNTYQTRPVSCLKTAYILHQRVWKPCLGKALEVSSVIAALRLATWTKSLFQNHLDPLSRLGTICDKINPTNGTFKTTHLLVLGPFTTCCNFHISTQHNRPI